MTTTRRVSPRKIAATINITPLIDILLVLLVIFMTASSAPSTVLETSVPQSSVRPRNSEVEPPVIVSLDREGAIQINHARLDGALRGRLEEILKPRRDRTVFVNANTAIDFELVAQVIDESRAAGATQVGLMTDRVE